MPFLDATIIEELESCFLAREVRLAMGAGVETIEATEEGARVTLDNGETEEADALLFCAGRQGAASTVSPEVAGIDLDDRGQIPVDEDFRTTVPHVFAAGDVIGYPSLASVSREQGRVAACRALEEPCRPVDTLLPYGIWTVPEIATVGPTEREARDAGIDVETGIGRYEDTARGQIIGDTQGLLKLVVDRADRKLIAAHIIGTGGAELIHFAQLAISFGATYTTFVRQVMNYPTLSRVFKLAAWDLLEKLGD